MICGQCREWALHKNQSIAQSIHPTFLTMTSSGTSQLDIPVFAGQVTAAANSSQTRQQALHDASSPSGSILLSSCYEAFYTELSTLTPDQLEQVDIDISDFKTPNSLLSIPADRYMHNAVISGTTLFLIQSLRYLAFAESAGASINSLTPFSDVLKRNLEHGMGVLGFSSGILAACVVGTSLSTVVYISRAVEAYRLAFWIGLRTEMYRLVTSSADGVEFDSSLPWGLVFLGMSKQVAEEAITNFSKVPYLRLKFYTHLLNVLYHEGCRSFTLYHRRYRGHMRNYIRSSRYLGRLLSQCFVGIFCSQDYT